ncbi:hypothetical protein C8J56DRAFT_1051682 [Mycena floridula]|nr:hypothetical protein C8J56DRAFT_1051682 [Mycena floridula]
MALIIEELPTEIILLILQYLIPTELLVLSRCSRQFQRLAIPIYLGRYGMELKNTDGIYQLPPFDFHGRGDAINIIKGLRSGRFISTIQHFHCQFRLCRRFADVEVPLILSLLSNWKSIQKATFSFDRFPCIQCRGQLQEETYSESWKQLVSCVDEKSTKVMVVVREGFHHGLCPAEQFKSKSVAVLAEYSDGRPLQHLQFGSDTSLTSSFGSSFHYTMSLSTQHNWESTVSMISMPNVTMVTIAECLGFQRLLPFLLRHPDIQIVEDLSPIPIQPDRMSQSGALPSLTTLIATPEQMLRHILPSFYSNKALPALRNISLVYEHSSGLMRPLHRRSALPAVAALDREIALTMHLLKPDSQMLWDSWDEMDEMEPLRNVCSLEMRFAVQYLVSRENLDALFGFMGPLFPCLRAFTLSCRCEVPLEDVVQQGKRAFGNLTIVEVLESVYTR